MPNKIKPRRSYTANSVPLVADLEENEMAVNWTDGKIFVRQNNAIVTLTLGGSGGSGGSLSGSVTIPASGDQYWSNTTLLLKGDGGLTDSSSYARALTNNGGVSVSTSTKKFGTGSLQFTGASGSYLSSTSSDWAMSGDFTIEGWAWLDSSAQAVAGLFSSVVAGENPGGIIISRVDFYLTSNNFENNCSVGWTFPVNEWTHFACVNDNGTLRAYLNGVQQGTAAKTVSVTSTALSIGSRFSNLQQYNWKGFADDLRITAGVCRYPSGTTFTPPAATYATGAYTAPQTLPLTITGSGGGGGGLSWSSVPASATATGTAGQIAYDASYVYVATGASQWKRSALSTWFTPAQFAGLQLHLDASDASTLYDSTIGGALVASDGAIARWEDKSGNGRHFTQATSANRPTRKTAQQNGLSAVLFDGTNDNLAGSDFLDANTGGLTIFVVMKRAATGVLHEIVSKFDASGGWLVRIDGENKLNVSVYADSSLSNRSFRSTSNAVDASGFCLVAVSASAGSFQSASFFRNGSLLSADAASEAGTNGRTPPNTTDPVRIGVQRYSGTDYFPFSGHIGEIIAYDSALSSGDRAAVEAYLMTKWGIS